MSRLAGDQADQMQAVCVMRMGRKDLAAELLGFGEPPTLVMRQRLGKQGRSRAGHLLFEAWPGDPGHNRLACARGHRSDAVHDVRGKRNRGAAIFGRADNVAPVELKLAAFIAGRVGQLQRQR
jgi:hypothetical protein